MPDRDSAGWVGSDEVRSPASTGWLTSFLGFVGLALAGVVLVAAGAGWSKDEGHPPQAACRVLLRGRECPVFSLAWSPDGRKLAVSGFDSVVRLWAPSTGQTRTVEGGTEQPRFVLGWSADGDRLVVGGLEVPVESWDLRAVTSSGAQKVVRPDTRADGIRMITEAARGTPIRVRGLLDSRAAWLPASRWVANSVAFAVDGRSVVTAESDQSVRIYEAGSGRLRHTLRGESRGISAVVFSPDGSKVASGGGGPPNVWDSNSGALLATLGGTSGGSAVVGFSPDGALLAVAGWDGSIRVWDLSTGQERAKLGGHDGQILTMAWSPNGKQLASGGYDSTVRVWDVPSPAALAIAD